MKRKKNETMEALENAANLKQDMECGILVKFDELRLKFLEIDSPDKARLKENKIKELEDLLHGDNAGATLAERGSFKFYARNYVKEYILNGKMKVVEKSDVGGFYLAHEYEWIIDTHAHYKFHQWLTSAEGDEIGGLFDYTPYLKFQLIALKNSCKQFIESGDRAIYRRESIPQILKAAHTMGTSYPDRFALKFHGMIKEAFEDSYVHEALSIKGICPGIKGQIETTLKELQVLIARMEAVKQRPPKVYSFDDWLNNVFVTQSTWAYDPPLINNVDGSLNWGRMILNDSELYDCLAPERMSHETIKQIRNCQAEAYDKIVTNEYNHRVSSFTKKVDEIKERFNAETGVNDFVSSELGYIQKFQEVYPEHFEAIISVRKFRNMPYGAKFITAEQYKKPEEILPSLQRLHPNKVSKENVVMVRRNGRMTRAKTTEGNEHIRYPYMCEGEMEYAFMEGITRFKYWLEKQDFSNGSARAIFDNIQQDRTSPLPEVAPTLNAAPVKSITGESKKIQQPSIALIYFYNDVEITKQNKDEVAREYGYTKDESGSSILHEFYEVGKADWRIGAKSRRLNKIRLGQLKKEVLPSLKGKAKDRCKADIEQAEIKKEEFENF